MIENKTASSKSGNSDNSDSLTLLSKKIVLRGGNSVAAKDMNWVPVGVYTVTSVTGATGSNDCPNGLGKDGNPGTATLFYPFSIDIDSANNILIVEKHTDFKLRMMSPRGTISTILKGGGDVIDGALSSKAKIYNYSEFVLNKANDVFYFVEAAHHQLRTLIADSGNTFSGKPAPGFKAGIGTITSTSGNENKDGNQQIASFYRPFSIGIDPKGTRAYISQENNFLRMVDITGPNTFYVSTLFTPTINNSTETISNITVDNSGNVFFIVFNKHAIWKFVPPAAGVRTSAGPSVPLYSFSDPIHGPKVFAGNVDISGYKDGFGATALFKLPLGLCVDKKNNLYVADCDNNIVRYITPAGQVYTYAGAQSTDPNLDGVLNGGDGSHMAARFSNPRSVAIDKLNNLFVLDKGKNKNDGCSPYCRIRKISRVPPLTLAKVETNSVTITWPPLSEWMPDTPPGEETTYSYIISPVDRDFEVSVDTISSPLTITNLSDSTRYSIQIVVSNSYYTVTTPVFPFVTKIEPSNFVIRTPVSTTVAGKGTTVPNISTTVLEWDGAKGADTLSYSISPPDAFSRSTVTLHKNQKSPYCISDLDASKTYTITLTATMINIPGVNGGPLTTYSVTSPSSTFTTPALRSMEIGTICGRVNEGGEVTNATKIPRPASTTTIQNPRGVVLDKHGNLFVTSNSCVLKIAPPTTNVYVYMRGQVPSIFLPTPHTTSNSTVTIYAGLPFSPFGGTPSDATGDDIRFYNMSGMAYDPLEDAIYISDSQLHLIVKLTSDSKGVVTSKVLGRKDDGENIKFADGPVGEARFNTPKGIAIGPDGSLFIADCYNNGVRRIYQGNVTTIARSIMDGNHNVDNLFKFPYGIAALYDGTVYVTSTWRNCIKKLTPNGDGTYTTSLYAGEDSDNGGDADGTLLNARFNKPEGLFVDVNNNIYVYDVGNYKIKLLSGGRSMTVFGGKGYKDGNKNDARLEGASLGVAQQQDDYAGLTSDNNGNIYFTDWGNGLVRCAFPEPPPIIDKATYDTFWSDRNESAAVAQTTSSAISLQASSAKINRASSSIAYKASSALANRESSAKASSAVAQAASSPVAQVASSALVQRASSARASSAVAQVASSAVAHTASSALAQRASSAQASSAVAQVASSAVAQVASSAVASSALAQRESSAVAQTVSSALAQRESSAQESSAVIQKASSAVAQVASSAQESSAVAQRASSAVIQRASSAVAQVASSAQESSAVAQRASSAVAQGASSAVIQAASSAVAQVASSAQESSAVAQQASSAVIQRASSAVAQVASSAKESSAVAQQASSAVAQQASSAQVSSAVAQIASSAKESSAVAQVASSAVAQRVSSAQESSAVAQRASSAVIQGASSAVAQIASSAIAQTVSSAVAERASSSLVQRASSAQESSALAQTASSAVAQRASSSLVQRASSALAQKESSALAQGVSSALAQRASSAHASSAQQIKTLYFLISEKDSLVEPMKWLESDISTQLAVLYSRTESDSNKALAKDFIASNIISLEEQWSQLWKISARIFALSPMYQDRVLQTRTSDPYLESKQLIRMYDSMRKGNIVVDSNGYIVDEKNSPKHRSSRSSQGGGGIFVSSGASAPYSFVNILSTDVLLSGDLTIPTTSIWLSYFDTVARRYFYVNTRDEIAQYEHPFLPVFSANDTVITDLTSSFLPAGWIKLTNAATNLPYYFNVNSTEASWIHPAPPPNPNVSRLEPDPTIFPSYKKYISTTPPTTGKAFYVNSITKEAQWTFPDPAFNVGPSTAQQASSALAQSISGAQESSAVVQRASSAVRQTASSALAQSISGAQESSAVAQRASSALAQTASSALAQSISGAQESSAVAQRASSAQQQTASSAVAQEVSSARQQAASSAQQEAASSAVAQKDSSAQQQAASSAVAYKASSAQQQAASSAQQQAASSAIAQKDSSAQQQAASSAVAYEASSAQQQEASSAQQQGASSAVAQKDSSAQQQAASSAVAQVASSAVAQAASSAEQQRASSAYQQTASSAIVENTLKGFIELKDEIKNELAPLKEDINKFISEVYSKNSDVTMSTLLSLRDIIANLVSRQADLKRAGENIFRFKSQYQDTSLQTVVPDTITSKAGVTKVFDTLRNTYIWLDANKKIIANPDTPMTRSYSSTMKGGNHPHRASRTPRMVRSTEN